MRLLLTFCILVFLPSSLMAQNGYLEVTAPGSHLLQLVISPPVALAGPPNADVAKELSEVLTFDMTMTGLFTPQAVPPAGSGSGIRSGDFSYEPWKAAGTDLIIKCGYNTAGSNLTLECRLHDVPRSRELAAKRYTGNLKELRRMAHSFADEVLRAFTGEAGPFAAKIAFVSTLSGNKEIYLMDYDGQNVQKLTSNRAITLNPDFSPNGRELVYTSYKKGNPDLYRRDIGSGSEARISSHRGINITASWAPDGARIALALSKDGNSAIYIIDKEGKLLNRLTHDDAISVSPTWSPDGKQIAFVSDRLGKPQIFIMNADGGAVRRLTTSGSYNVSPRWSPKGDRIVYTRQESTGFKIRTINPDGTNDTQLTSEGNNEHPRWSPDGRFVTFSSKRAGNEAIFIMRADGTGQTLVHHGKGEASHPTWSPH